MADFSTFRVGGPAQALVVPRSVGDLAALVAGLAEEDIPWYVIGRGSNILVPDSGVAGVVIVMSDKLAALKHVGAHEKLANSPARTFEAEAGCSIAKLLNWCAGEELAGLEFLAGIPGSVGGAIAMNAGAMGHEICAYVDQVRLLDKSGTVQVKQISAEEIRYRKWTGGGGAIILSGRFTLSEGSGERIKKECRHNLSLRKNRQPHGASAGSFFKNPPGDFAGRLIEEAGLKGQRIGGAEVSQVHANFIVNKGGATASDILELKNTIQQKVRERSGVWLEPEVKILGD
jgi:UDP-N-acetylmuramate dehydrogenase